MRKYERRPSNGERDNRGYESCVLYRKEVSKSIRLGKNFIHKNRKKETPKAILLYKTLLA